jgi:hypothetical protein
MTNVAVGRLTIQGSSERDAVGSSVPILLRLQFRALWNSSEFRRTIGSCSLLAAISQGTIIAGKSARRVSMMSGNEAFQPTWFRRAACKMLSVGAVLALAAQGSASAEKQTHQLQGLFCNTEDQLDEALGHIGRNVSPRAAAELTNDEAIVCTYVDLLQYVIERPLVIGEIPGIVPLIKYQATLTGVVVGGAIRAVSPPVGIFFVAPERLEGARAERGA